MLTFSYNLQYAEFDDDQVDDKGVAPARDILVAFDAFDWRSQVETASRLQKCSPTFSVVDIDSDRLFWVSGCGDANGLTFVNAYTYQGERRRFFGLSRSRGPVSPETRELSLEEARRGIELFLKGDHEGLLRLLAGRSPSPGAA
jgi:hypothetical protein